MPSLLALRAFEAAARNRSLTAAARELHVTPAAISHRVKDLEADLGFPLLHRGQRQTLPTDRAAVALPLLTAAFEQLGEAVRLLRIDTGSRVLTISVGPTFASTWLVRRLGDFKRAHPDIRVRIDTTDAKADFRHDGVDVGIRFGPGEQPGLVSTRLFAEAIYPVCSPKLVAEGAMDHPDDLARHTLLHVDWTLGQGETYDWEMWLRAAGATVVDGQGGETFSHTSLALQAAIEGQGVALGSDSVAGDYLADGRLVRPFELSLPMALSYHLVYPPENAGLPKVRAFRDWVLAQTVPAPGAAT